MDAPPGLHLAAMLLFAMVVKVTWDFVAAPGQTYMHNGSFTFTKMLRSVFYYSDMGSVLYVSIVLMHNAMDYYHRYQESMVNSARLQAEFGAGRRCNRCACSCIRIFYSTR